MKKLVILVAGGTGFVGRHVVQMLERKGHRVIIHHRKHKAVPTHADVIINCVGIIREDEQTFQEAHVDFTKWLLGLGKKLKVQRFVFVSAIGANPKGTNYQKTKFAAEQLVRNSGLNFAIIRPSMIFGAEDKSINIFRAIARTGVFPIFAHGKVQPVHVETVARMVVAAAEGRIKNRVAEVGGPEIMTYMQLVDRIHPGVHTVEVPKVVTPLFTLFSDLIPTLPTDEQIQMLNEDNITKDKTVQRLKIKNPRLK